MNWSMQGEGWMKDGWMQEGRMLSRKIVLKEGRKDGW